MAIRWDAKKIRQPPIETDPKSPKSQILHQFKTYDSKYLEESTKVRIAVSPPHKTSTSKSKILSPHNNHRLMSPNHKKSSSNTQNSIVVIKQSGQDEQPPYHDDQHNLVVASFLKTPKHKKRASQAVIPQIIIQLSQDDCRAGSRTASRATLRHDCSHKSFRKNGIERQASATMIQREDLNAIQMQYLNAEAQKQISSLEEKLRAEEEKSQWKQNFWKNKLQLEKQKNLHTIKQINDDYQQKLFQQHLQSSNKIQNLTQQIEHFQFKIAELHAVIKSSSEIRLYDEERDLAEEQMKNEIASLKLANQNLQNKVQVQESQIEKKKKEKSIVIDLNSQEQNLQIETLQIDLQAYKAANLVLEQKNSQLQSELDNQNDLFQMKEAELSKQIENQQTSHEKQIQELNLKLQKIEYQQFPQTEQSPNRMFQHDTQTQEAEITDLKKAEQNYLLKIVQLEVTIEQLKNCNQQLEQQLREERAADPIEEKQQQSHTDEDVYLDAKSHHSKQVFNLSASVRTSPMSEIVQRRNLSQQFQN